MFASHGNLIGLAKLVQGYRLSAADGQYISTKTEGKNSIKLKVNEIVLQVKFSLKFRTCLIVNDSLGHTYCSSRSLEKYSWHSCVVGFARKSPGSPIYIYVKLFGKGRFKPGRLHWKY